MGDFIKPISWFARGFILGAASVASIIWAMTILAVQ